ncbi:lambda exonuclease family protein [Halomonas sp. 86]|uniref:lambda exonuclease family protein n=1 Tax=unclassified Halomonas TaxID=2609666 RepID=UPI004034D192
MKILHLTQGSAEWLAARAGVITASKFVDARATLSRASKNGKAGDPAGKAVEYAWQVALERIAGEPVSEAFATWQMRRGTELEPEARMAYEMKTGLLASEEGLILSDDGLFGYSADGLVDDDGIIEIKCPANCQKIGDIWTNPEAAADEYIDQIQGGMWITGRKWCDFIMYCPWLEPVGKELFRKRIERDDDYIAALESDLNNFAALVGRYETTLRAEAA